MIMKKSTALPVLAVILVLAVPTVLIFGMTAENQKNIQYLSLYKQVNTIDGVWIEVLSGNDTPITTDSPRYYLSAEFTVSA